MRHPRFAIKFLFADHCARKCLNSGHPARQPRSNPDNM